MDSKRVIDNLREANEAGVNLLLTDVETALTFLDAAEVGSNPEDRSRRIRSARKAYETILRLRPRFTLDAAQTAALDKGLKVLRERLIHAGALEKSVASGSNGS